LATVVYRLHQGSPAVSNDERTRFACAPFAGADAGDTIVTHLASFDAEPTRIALASPPRQPRAKAPPRQGRAKAPAPAARPVRAARPAEDDEVTRMALGTGNRAPLPPRASSPAPAAVASPVPSPAAARPPGRVFLCTPTVIAQRPEPPANLAQGSIADQEPPRFAHGQYRIVAPLGYGAMGAVYRAEHGQLRRPVALKVLHPKLRRDREAQARFMAEAVATSRVQHPNVVTVYDYGQSEDGAAFLVMELLQGESLASLLSSGQHVSMQRAVELARQIASALTAVHAAGIVHRDLKPENIFVTRDPLDPQRDLVKLLDFGVCKMAAESANVTRVGNLLGTPHYMAPEQGKNARVADPRSDIYAVGCMLYEMLCGRLPFGGDMIDVLMAHQSRRPEPPRRLNPEVPPELDQLVMTMLAKDPTDRPRDMIEVERRLASIDPARRFAALPAAPADAELDLLVHELAARPRRRLGALVTWLAVLAGAGGLAALALGG
jgi:predicted Ser/Thr protein kinase